MEKLATLIPMLLIVVLGRPSSADEHLELLKAWGEDFVGTWENETKLDVDIPGFGEKGDTLEGVITFEAADGVYRGTWTGTINGQPAGLAVAAIGWDASRKVVRVQWFSKQGRSASNAYRKAGKKWRARRVAFDADGTKSTSTSTVTVEDGVHVHAIINRTRGDEALPDKKETWTKK